MPYKFAFDLSRVPRFFFKEITKIGYQKNMHKQISKSMQNLIKKFRLQEATGLALNDVVLLVQDFVDLQARNLLERERFIQTKKRALLLPHCSRKFMDSHCKASFDPAIPSYICAHCSPDCLINKAVMLAEKKGYDVYVLPGSSCVSKILRSKHYEGIIGVACGEEIRVSGEALREFNVAGQAVPLIKNGCANTTFNIETLATIL